MGRCAGCGTDNAAGAAYCSTCARPLTAETQQQVEAVRASHSATAIRWGMVVLGIVIILLIIAAVVFEVVHGL